MTVTVIVEVLGDTTKEQAELTMLVRYLVRTLGVEMVRFWGASGAPLWDSREP